MTIKVCGMWYSSASSRVLELLLEKQIEFELIEVDVIEGQQKQPEYVALQVGRFSLVAYALIFLNNAATIESCFERHLISIMIKINIAPCTFAMKTSLM